MHSHESIITTERSIRDVTQTRPRPLRRLDPRASNQRIHQVNQIVPPSHLRRGQSPHALATGLAGCTHFALAMSRTRASHAAWTRPPSVFSSSSRVIARASTVADSTHGRGAVARVTAEAPRAPFARARTASVVVVVIVTVIVIVIARGSDGRSSPQGPQGGASDRSGLFEDIPIGEVFFVRVFLIHS